MRKVAVVLGLLAAAAMSSTADAAKKKKEAAAQPAAQTTNPNEASARFVRDAIPVFLPSWAIPLYLSQQKTGPHAYSYQQQQQQQNAKKGKRQAKQ